MSYVTGKIPERKKRFNCNDIMNKKEKIMTKETERLVELICEYIILYDDIDLIEKYYILNNISKEEIIQSFKDYTKLMYYENLDMNYRIDEYGNAIEEDGSITSFEKIIVYCNIYLRQKYNIGG